MTTQTTGPAGSVRKRSTGLLIVTFIFGLLYLSFIILSLVPNPAGSPVSTTLPYQPFDREQIYVKALFVLFLVGYIVAWRNEGIGGAMFILWFLAMWGVELLIVAPIKPKDWGGGIAMGFPLFVLGILFVVRWYRRKGN